MPTEIINGLVGGAGVAGIWLLCIMFDLMFTRAHMDDKNKQIEELKEAVRLAELGREAERRRGDAAVEAAQTSNLLLAGIRRGPSSEVEH